MLILLSYLHDDGKKLSPLDFASRLRTWVEMGLRALDTLPLGLGQTIGTVVRATAFLEDPEGTARDAWVKGMRDVAPNGSLMRTHPLGPMCLWRTLEETFEVAASFSVVTHADPRCVVSCAIGTALIRGIIRGEVYEEKHIEELVAAAVTWYTRWRREKERTDESRSKDPPLDLDELYRHTKANTLADLELDDGPKIGYVYKTFGSGILLLRQAMRQIASTNSIIRTPASIFEPLITDLIMQGGDADTNACFAGALLGAYLGFKALPLHWRDGLRHGEWLLSKSEALCMVLGIGRGSYSGVEDKDTHLDGGRGMLTKEQMEERWMILQVKVAQEYHEQ
ncbi:hypothetical protein TrVGV298_002350 [Trichoderma virens]|nr:hypothetical protein TrVGV298_002350 [Trichoderma virens]